MISIGFLNNALITYNIYNTFKVVKGPAVSDFLVIQRKICFEYSDQLYNEFFNNGNKAKSTLSLHNKSTTSSIVDASAEKLLSTICWINSITLDVSLLLINPRIIVLQVQPFGEQPFCSISLINFSVHLIGHCHKVHGSLYYVSSHWAKLLLMINQRRDLLQIQYFQPCTTLQ